MKNSILLTAGGLKLEGNFYRKQILRFGRWVHPQDNNEYVEFTPDLANKMIANFKAKVYGDIPFLMHPEEHLAHDAGPEYTKGFVRDLIAQPDGLYADVEVIDPIAKELVAKNLIPGVSIELIHNYKDHEHDDKEVGPVLGHVASCNAPYIKNMRGWEPTAEVKCKEGNAKVLYFSEDKPMTKEEMIAALKAQGIDVASLQAATTQLATLTTEFSEYKKKNPVTPPTEIEKNPAFIALMDRVTAAETKNTTMLSDVNKAQAETAAVKKAAKDKEATEAVELLLKEGRIKPVDKATWLKMAIDQPDSFALVAPTLAVVVDLQERGTSGDPHRPVSGTTLSEDKVKTEVKGIVEAFIVKKKPATAA